MWLETLYILVSATGKRMRSSNPAMPRNGDSLRFQMYAFETACVLLSATLHEFAEVTVTLWLEEEYQTAENPVGVYHKHSTS